MTTYENPLVITAKGAVAGLVGTAVLSVTMQYGPQLMESLGFVPSQANQGDGEEPTAKLAEKVAEGVLDTSIEEDTKQIAGQAIHWGYGAGWGAFYGIAQSSLRMPHFLHGTLFGALVAIVASTLVPAMGLTPPPSQQPTPISVMQLVQHLIYGWVTALVFGWLARDD